MRISEQLEPVLASLLSQNQEVASALRGGAFCATIERPPDGEPWVQVKQGVLNVFYPCDDDPMKRLGGLVELPADVSCPAWEPWKYATLEFSPISARIMAELIERLFLNFYDFPADTKLSSEILDMR